MDDLDKLNIQRANQWLKEAGIRVSLYGKGHKLYLRATLPDKTTFINRQQYITTNLHITDIVRGKKLAIQLQRDIEEDTFSWSNWGSTDNSPTYTPDNTISKLLEKHRQYYFTKRGTSVKTTRTYHTEYHKPFSILPANHIITEEILIKALSTTQPNTRNRRRFVTAYVNLARFANLPENTITRIRDFKGDYNYTSVTPRYVPTDTEIIEHINLFHNKEWQWVFKAMAVWGLRPHEVFYIDPNSITSDGLVTLQLQCLCNPALKEGAKGTLASRLRTVYPCYSNWFHDWDVSAILLPPICGKDNRDIGHRVNQGFEDNHVPYSPYSLRHAYALRLEKVGIPESLAATIMGHSVQVHRNTYFRDRRYDHIKDSFNVHKDKLILDS